MMQELGWHHLYLWKRRMLWFEIEKQANGENQVPATEEELDQVMRAMVCALSDDQEGFDQDLVS